MQYRIFSVALIACAVNSLLAQTTTPKTPQTACPANFHKLITGFGSYCAPDNEPTKCPLEQTKDSRFIDCKKVSSAANIYQSRSSQSKVVATLRCREMVQFLRDETGWVRIKTSTGTEGYVSFAFLSIDPVSSSEGVGIPTGSLPKDEEAKVLAAELRSMRTVCVVPPEMRDGTQAYSDAGQLAKVLRDRLGWGGVGMRRRLSCRADDRAETKREV